MSSPKSLISVALVAVSLAIPSGASADPAAAEVRAAQDECPTILAERRDRARGDLNFVKKSISSSTRAVAKYTKARKNAKTKSGRAKAAKKLTAAKKRLKNSKTALPNIQGRFDAAQRQAVNGGCAP